MSIELRGWKDTWRILVLYLLFISLLAGCGTIRTYYASFEMHDEANEARNSRPLHDQYAVEIAQRFGLMALFATVAYRNDLELLRKSHKIESDCSYEENSNYGMLEAVNSGSWIRLQSIPSTLSLNTSVGCPDDRVKGLFYETYVYKNNKGIFKEAVIAYRGTENNQGQFLSDWTANLSAFFGFEPAQYKLARQKPPKLISTLKRLNHKKNVASDIQIFVT